MMQLNIELTSKCSKHTLCFMCGHQDKDVNPGLKYGDMDFSLLESIRKQLSPGPIIEFHRDGDPVDYPKLGLALNLFNNFITCLVTHGERLYEKADEIIDNCTTVCVSVIRGDKDADIQLESVSKFLETRGDRQPMVIIKAVGEMDEWSPYKKMGLKIIHRQLHTPDGNYRYSKHNPLMPESGICLDFIGRPAIDWQGRVFQCVKLDVDDSGYLGNLNEQSLDKIWNGTQRMEWLEAHKRGRRDLASPLCKDCKFWGVPSEA